MNSGIAEVQIDKTIIERTLGLTGMGAPSPELTYFSYFSDTYKERLSQAVRQPRKRLTPREKRPKYEGLFIAWKALRSLLYKDKKKTVKQCETASHLYFVLCALPKILSSSIAVDGLRNLAVEAMPQVEELRGVIDFGPSERAVVPSDINIRDGYYTVDTRTRSCYSCEFWVTHGSGTIQCKHIHAVEAFRDAIQRYNDGMSKHDTLAIIENDLCLYIKNRENSKSAAGKRDDIFLRGNNRQILRYLKSGAVSTLETAQAVSDFSISQSLAPVIEKQKEIYNRRNIMGEQETDENTCRICGKDDTAALNWIGCDHEPRCLGGAGWYHIDCVGLSEEPEGAWICNFCNEDDRDMADLNGLLDDSDDKDCKLPAGEVLAKPVTCKAGVISKHCIIVNGAVLFLKLPFEISKEFTALGIQLHDKIDNISISSGNEWEPFDGTFTDLADEDVIRFTLHRNHVRKSTGPSSLNLLPLSSDAREVGCGRDMYYKMSELPTWLSSDAARPNDVQRVRRKGIRHTKYANPNAKKVTRNYKRKILDNTNLVYKAALKTLPKNVKQKL